MSVSVFVFVPSARGSGAMFSSQAGFHQARFGRSSIVVAKPPVWMAEDVGAALKYWNGLAGWTVLRIGTRPQIMFLGEQPESCSEQEGCASAQPGFGSPYESCVIWVRSIRPAWPALIDVLKHEFGHCLGFAHQQYGSMASPPTPDRVIDKELLIEGSYVG